MKNLPYCETETFEVKFDPQGANLEFGDASTVLPIQVGLPNALTFVGVNIYNPLISRGLLVIISLPYTKSSVS